MSSAQDSSGYETETRSPAKPLTADNVGTWKPDACYTPKSIKDRVQQWQKLGETPLPAPVPAKFIVPPRPINDSEVSEGSTQTSVVVGKPEIQEDTKPEVQEDIEPEIQEDIEPESGLEADLEIVKVVKVEPPTSLLQDENLGVDVRVVNAPRKRVVSDEHWLKSKSAPSTPAKTPAKIVKVTPNSGFVKSVETKRPEGWVRIKTTPTKAEKQNPDTVIRNPNRKSSDTLVFVRRRKVSTKAKDEPKQPPAKPADPASRAIQAWISAEQEATAHKRNPEQTRLEVEEGGKPDALGEVADEANGNVNTAGTPVKDKSQAPKAQPASAPSRLIRSRRRAARMKNAAEKNAKAHKIDRSNEPVDDEETPVQSSRIHSWLGEMPDPFVEKPETLKAGALAPPSIVGDEVAHQEDESSKTKGRRKSRRRSRDFPSSADNEGRRRFSYESSAGDQSYQSGESDKTASNERKRKEEQRRSTASTPTLRRSGARHGNSLPRTQQNHTPDTDFKEDPVSAWVASLNQDTQTKAPNSRNREPAARNLFPTTGNRLSTIASAEVLQPGYKSGLGSQELDADSTGESRLNGEARPSRPPLKRKVASHADLISVLSMPEDDSQSLVSAHSIRTIRPKINKATIAELLDEFKTDETKYLRELKTLVDGVIPVLLSAVLSKGNDSVTSDVLARSRTGQDATSIIVDMGIALERLKSAHRRAPLRSLNSILVWAQETAAVYEGYLRAWRMGFQDVVVNLAPGEEDETNQDKALPRNEDGFVVNADGEKVDVAYLLKRPLIRLKYLARSLRGINELDPTSRAASLAAQYQQLVKDARKRQDEERARLEDVAAANIDATRARDPETLAPLVGTCIDPERSVRARDIFDMELQHSSGQRIDCKTEFIYRDRPDSGKETGEILVCEVDSTSRWLLFPPFKTSFISARRGSGRRELIMMIRGTTSHSKEWREILVLRSPDENLLTDWLKMLSSTPIPPSTSTLNPSALLPESTDTSTDLSSRQGASQAEIQVPFGEQASNLSAEGKSRKTIGGPRPMSMPLRESRPRPQTSDTSTRSSDLSYSKIRTSEISSAPTTPRPRPTRESDRTKSSFSADRRDPTHRPRNRSPTSSDRPNSSSGFQVWFPPSVSALDYGGDDDEPVDVLPKVNPYTKSWLQESGPRLPKQWDKQQVAAMSGQQKKAKEPEPEPEPIKRPELQSRSRYKQSPGRPNPGSTSKPQTPIEFHPPPLDPPRAQTGIKRRSSSPLKHEYEPTESDSSSARGDILSGDDYSITSESSIEEMFEPPPLNAIKTKREERRGSRSNATEEQPSGSPAEEATNKTIATLFSWSDRGFWNSLHADECSVIVSPGLIEAYEMSAAHSSMQLKPHPSIRSGDPMFSVHQTPSLDRPRPLVALELTPLVPLRRGTALDISIRSPLTQASKLHKAGNNIMFRSRSAAECEALYNLINQARINNPTYIALQNAVGPAAGGGGWSAYMDGRASERSRPSWWRLGSKKGSYRAGTHTRRTASSVAGQTESSVATMTSAFSALKRFTGASKAFNIAKSTISSKGGRFSGGHSTASYFSGSSGGASAPAPRLDPTKDGTPAGVTNTKIRLYEREEGCRWRDMGSARLTIMHPPRSVSQPAMNAQGKLVPQSKRVVVSGKTKGETLLDVTLGETSFERVARTGIAVSVWEYPHLDYDSHVGGQIGRVGKTGGVVGAQMKVYMIQMKSEAEAAFTFSLVGRLRY